MPAPSTGDAPRTAALFRMNTDQHVCPSGLKARDLLRRSGFEVDDQPLTTRSAQDAFKAEHGVQTTPQVFINGTRIGGYEALRHHLGLPVRDRSATTYRPVIAIFAITALLALAIVAGLGVTSPIVWAEWFLALSMVALATQKLQDVEGFANGFLTYDLLAQRFVPYARAYPFAEAFAGLGMVATLAGTAVGGSASVLMVPAAVTGLVIGGIGGVSVFKAVYMDRRVLRCACVGGGSNVPLGFVSLTENVMMVAMGLWMLAKGFAERAPVLPGA